MSTTTDPHCSVHDERVIWVPIRIPATASYSPTSDTTNNTLDFFPDFPTTTSFDMTTMASEPIMWDQLPAAPAFPPLPLDGSLFSEPQFDLGLGLDLDICLDLANFNAVQPTDLFSQFNTKANPSPLSATAFDSAWFPETASPFPTTAMDGAFLGDAWQLGSPSASGSSLGSPAMTTPPSGTPLSTPPTPELHLCSEPTCFEAFTKGSDLKKHERKHKQNFCCPLCRKAHLDKRALDRHLWSKHEDYAIRSGAKSEKAKCRLCDYTSRADNVRRHEKSQHSVGAGSALRRR